MAEEPTTFEERLIAVQKELNAPKSRTNSFGGYSYRSAEDILEAVKPLLAARGLLLTLSDHIVEIGGRVYVVAEARIRDGDRMFEVTAYAREEESKKGMDAAQITGSASSYARKYALNGLFLIDDDKDPDTDEHHRQTHQDRPAPPQPRPQPRPAPPPQRAPERAAPPPRQAPSNGNGGGGFRPSPAQMNFARSLWKGLGYIVVGEDGGTHHDAKQLDSYARQFFGAGFEDLDSKTMSALIDDLKAQTRAGAPER